MLLKVIIVICHYWFFNHGLKFQDSVCNFCYDLVTLSLNISNITIIAVRGTDYHCTIQCISSSEAIIFLKIMLLMIVGIYKMHIKEMNVKSWIYNYYFNNLIKAKKKKSLILKLEIREYVGQWETL